MFHLTYDLCFIKQRGQNPFLCLELYPPFTSTFSNQTHGTFMLFDCLMQLFFLRKVNNDMTENAEWRNRNGTKKINLWKVYIYLFHSRKNKNSLSQVSHLCRFSTTSAKDFQVWYKDWLHLGNVASVSQDNSDHTNNLELPVCIMCTSLDCRTKPQHWRE